MGNLSESFGLSQLFTVQADIDITPQLRQALALVDIELLDHVVVAGEKTYHWPKPAIFTRLKQLNMKTLCCQRHSGIKSRSF